MVPEGYEPADAVGPAAPGYFWDGGGEPGSVTSDQAEGRLAAPEVTKPRSEDQ